MRNTVDSHNTHGRHMGIQLIVAQVPTFFLHAWQETLSVDKISLYS